jgi:hypothetical protein
LIVDRREMRDRVATVITSMMRMPAVA